ncbi:oxidoreductase [Pseudomonas oryzihabitans]|nr:oxidoreductase [Pseudomonas psychrotolerans]KTT44212.1 oxidoreductase [Pseudomonas psychrotolerans]KTT51102.1 oxidoreductase [Pseudomonas psychrotolerans]
MAQRYEVSKLYDPLVNSTPGRAQPHSPSYWAQTVATEPPDDGVWAGEREVEVAIIGGGYTGLSCALHLARDHGVEAVVLEANRTAWGCSGRNGSFARISGGRVPLSELITRYGEDLARRYFEEMRAGLATTRALIAEGDIQCDAQPDGAFKVASKASHLEALRREERLYQDVLKYPARFVTAEDIQSVHAGAESFGALHMPDGFSLHPLKLAWGIQRLARQAGARVHPGSPVTDWTSHPTGHRLVTPSGVVRARRVVVATNGYTSPQLHGELAGRILPVHSQIIVTRPLSDEERRLSIPGTECLFDTRNLLFYYRRLPDNRILFGGRSAVNGRDAENPLHRERLLAALVRKFPVLDGIRVDYNWGGWVAVSHSSLPHCYRVPGLQDVFAGGGYAGSGVSFSLQTGKRLAQMLAGDAQPTAVPFLHQAPQRFPLQPFLRLGQRLAYAWYRFKDAE